MITQELLTSAILSPDQSRKLSNRFIDAQEALESGHELFRIGEVQEAMGYFQKAMFHHATVKEAKESIQECQETLWHMMNWNAQKAI